VSDGWRPIHDNHAIDVMAVAVVFAELIPTILFKRIIRLGEEVAVSAGLKGRQNVTSLQFTLGGASTMAPTLGQVFSSFVEVDEGPVVPNQFAEQLSVEQSQFVYRTSRYISWEWQSERIRVLVLPLLAAAIASVPLASIKMEYLDRFRFDAEDVFTAKYFAVLREGSPWIAPQVFSRNDLWHSNTGAFVPTDDGQKVLEQVQITVLDDAPPVGSDKSHTRWLNITTTRDYRFAQGVDVEPSNPDVMVVLNQMHTELKHTLASLITDAMTKRIGLWG
jgi:uncharacterized protein (TIGR04255 family)